MAKQVVDLGMLLLKIQQTQGVMETVLATTCLSEATKPQLTFDPSVTEVALSGSGFSQNASVIGPLEGALNGSYPVRTGGAVDSPGDWAIPLQACGFKETELSHVYTYTPSSVQSEWKGLTAYMYSGNKNTSGAMLRKLANILGTGKITLDFEKSIATFEFNGKGAYDGGAAATETQPAVTKSTALVQNLKGAVMSLFSDSDYIPISIEFDIGNEVNVTTNGANSVSGKGISVFTKRAIKWTMKCYRDTNVTPETTLLAGTTGTISVQWGTAPNKITVATTKAQITKADVGDQNGVETYDLSGICVDNDLTITEDTTVA